MHKLFLCSPLDLKAVRNRSKGITDMNITRENLLLYAVTDRTWLNGASLAEQVEKALKGGVTFVQLREKHLDFEAFLAEAKEIGAICKRYHVPFVINDNIEVAIAADADGVHVGQDDLEAGNVRKLLGPDKIIGVSAHSVAEARKAQEAGADYLGSGAAFPTGSKADTNVIGPETIREVCAAVDIPVVAIGGIGPENIPKLSGTGIAGAAVISALFSKPDIEAAACRLRETLQKSIQD